LSCTNKNHPGPGYINCSPSSKTTFLTYASKTFNLIIRGIWTRYLQTHTH
jgi:hypothetical protein